MKWFQLLVFGTVGLAALVGGITWGVQLYPGFKDAVSARGVVIEQFEDRSRASAGTVFFPVVEFFSENSGTVRFRDPAGSAGAPGYEEGTPVDVLYDPHNPANARIGSFKQIWTGPAAASVTGLILVGLSILLFVKIGRFEKRLDSIGPRKSKPGS